MTKVLAIDGIPVTDAKHPITLTITDKDCRGGDPKRPDTCAAARAIRRQEGVADVRVHLGRIYLRQNKGNWQRFKTPESMRNEIIAFDRGGAFNPGTYELSPIPPNEQKKRGKAHSPMKQAQRGKGKKRKKPHVVANVRTGPAI